jgi:hypothetical protein
MNKTSFGTFSLREDLMFPVAKGFAIFATVVFLIFLMGPLFLSHDPVGLIYNPINPFLLDRTYLGACNWALLMASIGWSLYYALRKSPIMWLWLLILVATTALYLYLQ